MGNFFSNNQSINIIKNVMSEENNRQNFFNSKSFEPIHKSQFINIKTFLLDPNDPPPIIPVQGFQTELKSEIPLDQIEISLEGKEQYSLYYKKHFFHSIQFGPQYHLQDGYKVLIRTKKSDQHFIIPFVSKSKIPSILQSLLPSYLSNIKLKEIKDINFQNELLYLEDRLLIKNYKFGILYCKAGQQTEDDIYSNECGSSSFEKFLKLLGEMIKLKGWKHFDGELDTTNDTTGTHSIFTTIDNFEIMFHVSTLLPFSSINKQQIERKRHIGNDICVIVFIDDAKTSFKPTIISSKYNHVYAVVQNITAQNDNIPKYKLGFTYKLGVKPFSPLLPSNPIFEHNEEFKIFLLTKLINAERASYNAPGFGVYRTRRDWLKNITQKYYK